MAILPPTLPLAAASQRLRGKPGRPRKRETVGEVAGDTRNAPKMAETTITPRLLTLEATAAYLGVSRWTVRDLEASGVLPRVYIPLPGGRDLRKLLFDKADLDRLIDAWKDSPR